jgi:hypothetical protein
MWYVANVFPLTEHPLISVCCSKDPNSNTSNDIFDPLIKMGYCEAYTNIFLFACVDLVVFKYDPVRAGGSHFGT